MNTHPVTITATRCYLGQIVVEIPDFCRDERLAGIIRAGGAMTRLLTARIRFDRLAGTGLASCYVRTQPEPTTARQLTAAVTERTCSPLLPFAELADALRADGLMF